MRRGVRGSGGGGRGSWLRAPRGLAGLALPNCDQSSPSEQGEDKMNKEKKYRCAI